MNNERVYYSHDAETHARREMAALAMLALTLGLGIGAMLAILFTPFSGKKARHDLAKSMGKDWENGRDAIGPMMKRFKKEFSDLRRNVEQRITRLT